MKKFFEYLDKIPKMVITVISLILVVILGVTDYSTGYEISFSIFYLLPILLVSWVDTRSRAILISFLSAATWLWSDIASGHTYSHPLISVWNTIMRLGIFLIIVSGLSEIKRLFVSEQKLSRLDFLTGVTNSRSFYELLKIEIDRSVRFNRFITIAYIDIDNFKQVNDTLGHNQGDSLLQLVAQTIKNNIRSIDIVSRLGGDEFAIIFSDTNESEAKIATSKVQKELLNIVQKNNFPVTFSIGAVTCYKLCTYENLIKQADQLMYKVKQSGKNSIEYKLYETPTAECNE